VANGAYDTKNGAAHKFICKTCSTHFTSRVKTISHDLKTGEETVFLAIKNDS